MVGHAQQLGHSHQVTNILIEVDGDRAGSESYVTARLWNRSESGEIIQLVAVGRYVDRWSRRDGIWAIDHRHFVDDPVYTTVRPAPADAAEEESARNAGERDPRHSADGGTARIRRTRCWDANRGWPGSSRPGPLGVRRPLGGVVMVVAAERMNAIPGAARKAAGGTTAGLTQIGPVGPKN